jgi:SAM-dependent methyltransferase
MLDDLVRRAARAGLANIVARQGDAQRLPYRDSTFDAAYLVSVLGEVPDAALALRELRRVLKAAGRLVIGEMFVDPDFISLPALRKLATDAGFVFERRFGPWFAYAAVFRPVAQSRSTPGPSRPSRAAHAPAGHDDDSVLAELLAQRPSARLTSSTRVSRGVVVSTTRRSVPASSVTGSNS